MGRKKLPDGMCKVQMSFVCSEEMRDYLRSKPNYSKYICELIENDRITPYDLEDIDFDREENKNQLKAILTRLFGE